MQVVGIKGPNRLMTLQHFNFIKGTSPDYMHCALLGTAKLLVSLWTETARCRGSEHDIRRHIPVIDQLLTTNIVTPAEIIRKPRGLSQLKHWKGMVALYYTQCYIIVY